MARRRAKPRSGRSPKLGRMLRGEVVGSGLVVVAILTLLSLLSRNRGEVTSALVNALRVAFGGGIWFVPVLVGALGLWIALRHLITEENRTAPRLVASAGLFLVLEATLHLVAGLPDATASASSGEGGGLTGWLISRALINTLGQPVAIGALLIATALAITELGGWSLAEVTAWIGNVLRRVRSLSTRPSDPAPMLPLHDVDPIWRRPLGDIRAWINRRRAAQAATTEPSLVVNSSADRAARLRAPAHNGPRPAGDRPTSPGQEERTHSAPATSKDGFRDGVRIIGDTGQVWRLPVLSEMLEDVSEQDIQSEDLRLRAQIIEDTLLGFGIPVQVVEANQGPAVTQFGVRPGTIVRRNAKGEERRIKVRVAQIQALANDLSLSLAASPLRIEAPVPGRDVVGIEVPNVQISLVSLRGVMESEEYQSARGTLLFSLGRDVSGQSAVADLTRMPHLLIAGATGSGKSVCVNSIITALLLTHTPQTLRFLMVDPKRVELTVYNGIPHLIAPVVVDVERAVPVLQWATHEMERRYKLFARASARNIEAYNERLRERGEQILPYVVILIDELADLMLSAPDDVERQICRIAQMARATGMHLVLATQRPSVDVVTGLIKANFPARIAFAVTSLVDSRVILDSPGAEQLLGRGDMLYMAPDASKLHRLQGCYVSDQETKRLVDWWKGTRRVEPDAAYEIMGGRDGSLDAPPTDDTSFEEPPSSDQFAEQPADLPWLPEQETLQQPLWTEMASVEDAAADRDEVYEQAVEEVRRAGRASVSLLQRKLRIGYSRAARLIDQMETEGVVGPDLGGSRGRDVLPVSSGADPRPSSV